MLDDAPPACLTFIMAAVPAAASAAHRPPPPAAARAGTRAAARGVGVPSVGRIPLGGLPTARLGMPERSHPPSASVAAAVWRLPRLGAAFELAAWRKKNTWVFSVILDML